MSNERRKVMPKTIIAIYSDPKSGGEEALGRAFNALVMALELKEKGEPFEVVFQGTGSRWPAEFTQKDHPVNALYEAVKDSVVGVSGGCADLFGATESVESITNHKLIRDVAIPGTGGMVDMAKHLINGDRYITF